ncbi:MAG: chorismate mutase, partial [Aestuariivirgaceae bacterium]
MDEQSPSPATLDQVRQKIDEIDTALLELLRDRFAASVRIRELKAASGQTGSSPMRPAREAIVMRRLMTACNEPLPASLMVRLWREIISSSTLIQADATVHCSKATLAQSHLRDLITDHFCQIPVVEHDTDDDALTAATGAEAAVAVLV